MSVAVYKAINAVQNDLCAEGITKARKNQAQNYNFRGIDDVYNALSPLLAKHGLCILPRIIARTCDERQTKSGGAMFYVTVEAEFDFVAASDGSTHVVRTFGEAMDSADKATNKAMSAAYKYAAFQAFAIPTEGDNDADAHAPQPAPKQHQSGNADLPTPQQFATIKAAFVGKPESDMVAWCNDFYGRHKSPTRIARVEEITARAAAAMIQELQGGTNA